MWPWLILPGDQLVDPLLELAAGSGGRGHRLAQPHLVGGEPRVLGPLAVERGLRLASRAERSLAVAFLRSSSRRSSFCFWTARLLADEVGRLAGVLDRPVERDQRLAVEGDLLGERPVLLGDVELAAHHGEHVRERRAGEEGLEQGRPFRLVGVADAVGELGLAVAELVLLARLLELDALELEVEVAEVADEAVVRRADGVDVVDQGVDLAPRRARGPG